MRWLPAATAGLLLTAILSGCGLFGEASSVPGMPGASFTVTPGGSPQHTGRPQASLSPTATVPATATATVALSPDPTRPGPTLQPPPIGTPQPSSAVRPLPSCRDGSKRAMGDPATDPSAILLDTTYRLPAGFVPAHLLPVSAAGLVGRGRVDASLVPDLRAMAKAARKAGAGVAVRSAYRSYRDQVATFAGWVARSNYRTALRFAARPGHSEHQLGTAIDFQSATGATPPLALADWARTASGRWMRQRSWEYGFIESYPRGKTSETCYGYEPWHFRYVGRDEAKLVHESGMTLRRYLWTHVTGVR